MVNSSTNIKKADKCMSSQMIDWFLKIKGPGSSGCCVSEMDNFMLCCLFLGNITTYQEDR